MMCGSYEIFDGIPRRAVPLHVLVGHGNRRGLIKWVRAPDHVKRSRTGKLAVRPLGLALLVPQGCQPAIIKNLEMVPYIENTCALYPRCFHLYSYHQFTLHH